MSPNSNIEFSQLKEEIKALGENAEHDDESPLGYYKDDQSQTETSLYDETDKEEDDGEDSVKLPDTKKFDEILKETKNLADSYFQ